MADLFLCVNPDCQKRVTATKNSRYRTHWQPDGEKCPLSSTEIPPRELQAGPVDPKADPGVPEEGRDFAKCPHCTRKVKLTALGYFEHHDQTLRGGDRCPNAGVRFRPIEELKKEGRVETVALPGDKPKGPAAALPKVTATKELEAAQAASPESTGSSDTTPTAPLMLEAGPAAALPASAEGPSEPPKIPDATGPENRFKIRQPDPAPSAESGAPTDESSPESATTLPASVKLTFGGAISGSGISQPGSPITQPGEVPEKGKMSERELEIAARVKEIFFAYQNRKTSDNRSAQTTLGPSEVGTPCDRRLAMSLMGVDPVNPGGDGWAAFVGTWMHEGMKAIFDWADGGTGRFATEVPVTFPSEEVPRGTTDLLDRTMFLLTDWKGMGEYSLKKFKADGPSELYRTQAHLYGLGASLQGEKIREVAIVGLPRAGRSLEEMWVHVEKYDKKIAMAALARVKKIRNDAFQKGVGPHSKLEVAKTFGTAADCTYCPFHLKGDKEMQKGCPGA